MKKKYLLFKYLAIVFCFLIFMLLTSVRLTGITLEYTIQEYLKQVAKNHPELKLNSYDPKVAAAAYHEARDMYSPLLDVSYNKIKNNVSAPGAYISGLYESIQFSTEISKSFALTGTRLSASLINYRAMFDFNMNMLYLNPGKLDSAHPDYNPYAVMLDSIDIKVPYDSWQSYYEFSIVQPLLRDGPFMTPGKKKLDTLKQSVRLSRSVYNMMLERTMFTAFSLYWQVQLNRKQLELTIESLNNSKEMLAKNRRRVKYGTVDISEVYDFEAALARLEAEYNNSKKNYANLKKEFLYTIGTENIKSNEIKFDLQDDLTLKQFNINREKIYENAKESRRDLEQARLQKKIAKLSYDIAKVTMLPRLDFIVTSSFYGKDYEDDLMQFNNPDLSKAIQDISFDKENMNLTLGLQFQMPLDFRAFKTVVERAKINHAKARQNMIKLDHSIKKDLDKLISEVEYYWETEKAYRKTVDIMGKKLKEYKKKYLNGQIDSGLYVRVQDDQRDWQNIHLVAIFSYKLAKAQLEMAQGIFLKKYDIPELHVQAKVK